MKKSIMTLSLVSALTLASGVSFAGDRHDDYSHNRYDNDRHEYYRDHHDHYNNKGKTERARVVHVVPIYRSVKVVTPHRECWDEPRRYHRSSDSHTSTIAGALIGGVVGNQFGGGSGKTALTIAGSLLGGSIGRDMNRYHSDSYTVREEQCHVSHDTHYERQLQGYDVTYRYQGKRYTTFMAQHPGKYISVDVSVNPSRRYY
jgi:uncharacterized protein YcfJ